jgi:hypothetical protein
MKLTKPLRWIFTIAFLMCVANIAHAAGGVDLSRRYLSDYKDDCAFGPAHINALRRYQVLLVPGYLSDLNPDHFADHMRWLASIGVEHKKLAIRSGHSVDINSAVIVAAIRASAKPVILIAHSKGAVDTLDALLTEPSLRSKVAGWISLQGPYFGSPVADKLLDGTLLNPLFAAVILGFFGGTRDSALGLTTAASQAYYRARTPAIGQLLRDVPAVAFASIIESAPGANANTVLYIPHEMLARDGIRNDGLVPLDSAVLPGMDFIKVSNVDHIAPVTSAQQPFDRVRMTKALLLALPALFRDLPRDVACTNPRL